MSIWAELQCFDPTGHSESSVQHEHYHTSRESWRGGGDTAPLSRPVQDRVETSQTNRNRVPESFFTSTGNKESNRLGTPEKYSRLHNECSHLFPMWTRKTQSADTVWNNITVCSYKYLVRKLSQRLRFCTETSHARNKKSFKLISCRGQAIRLHSSMNCAWSEPCV